MGAEYHVENPPHWKGEEVYQDFEPAAARALTIAIAQGESAIDVIIYSEEDARAFGGDDAVEQYRDDPDASVFERIVIKAHSQGRIA